MVVLPAPFGPSRPYTARRHREIDTVLRARTRPKDLASWEVSMANGSLMAVTSFS